MEEPLDFQDDYDHEENIEYILENVLMPDDGSLDYRRLQDEFNSQILLYCNCANNNNNCGYSMSCHEGRIKYNIVMGELVVAPSEGKEPQSIFECNDLCACKRSKCLQRRVQFGPRQRLEIFDSILYKSKGLRTKAFIPCGAFICEYAGELLTRAEAQRRSKLVDDHSQMNYILYLIEHTKHESPHIDKEAIVTIVDPSVRGNIGRYLNHSCEPNCEIYAVRINCPLPKIGIFAKRDIYADEELCFHYAGVNNYAQKSGKACLCGTDSCMSFIPSTSI